MTARTETYEVMRRLASRGINASFDQANTLRRASLTLHRWGERECGDGTGCIIRDEEGKAYWLSAFSNLSTPIADRERGALRRIAAVCQELGAHWFHQTDPRGCALYVSAEPLTDSDYNRGVAI